MWDWVDISITASWNRESQGPSDWLSHETHLQVRWLRLNKTEHHLAKWSRVKIQEMWKSNWDIRLVTLESPQDLASEAGGLCTALDRKALQGLLQNAQTACSHSWHVTYSRVNSPMAPTFFICWSAALVQNYKERGSLGQELDGSVVWVFIKLRLSLQRSLHPVCDKESTVICVKFLQHKKILKLLG